jgi:hypothetical protein
MWKYSAYNFASKRWLDMSRKYTEEAVVSNIVDAVLSQEPGESLEITLISFPDPAIELKWSSRIRSRWYKVL